MVSDFIRILRLYLLNLVRINRVFAYYHLKIDSIKACHPCDIDLTGSFVENRYFLRNSTIRSRLQFDIIQHNTATKIIRSFERDLVRLAYLRQ